MIGLLSKPSKSELMGGDTERRSGVYCGVHEHSSTGSTYQKTDCEELGKKSINFTALVRTCATIMLVAFSAACCAGALETSADEVSIDVRGGVQTLRGNVVVVHDGRTFKASKIVIRQDGNSIQEITATGGVSLQDGETIMTAITCRYAANLVIFSGSVVVQNSEIGTAKADMATYNTTTKKVAFTARGKVELVLNPGKEPVLFHGK
ncbi:MAG: hypothetical protein LBR78_00890 [Holosporales bacterium]|jgi:lipopolysaccharide transport protein LptA|nr:hypothetical protein [Holosporales bacterium]